jgi:hypothetical protein
MMMYIVLVQDLDNHYIRTSHRSYQGSVVRVLDKELDSASLDSGFVVRLRHS